MKDKDYKNFILLLLGVIIFLFVVAVNSMVSAAAAPDPGGGQYTDATLTDARRKLAEIRGDTATNTDANYDFNNYLTYPANYNGAVSDTQLLNGILRYLVSIRNIMLCGFGFMFMAWCHKKLSSIAYKMGGRGK